MDAKGAENLLIQVGATIPHGPQHVDLENAPRTLTAVARLIREGRVRSAHDCSEGGLLVAAAEMAFAGRLGLQINLEGSPRRGAESDAASLAFAETPTRILLEVEPRDFDSLARGLREAGVPFGHVGTFNDSGRFIVRDGGQHLANLSIEGLLTAWRAPLDW